MRAKIIRKNEKDKKKESHLKVDQSNKVISFEQRIFQEDIPMKNSLRQIHCQMGRKLVDGLA